MNANVQEAYRRLRSEAEDLYRKRREPDKIQIQVGSATCELAAGAGEVEEEFRRHIEASGRSDLVLRRTGCTGRDSQEPIVGVLIPGRIPVKYQQVDRDAVHRIFTSHVLGGEPVWDKVLDSEGGQPYRYEVIFCDGIKCGRNSTLDLRSRFEERLKAAGGDANLVRMIPANCFGLCSVEERGKAALVLVQPGNVLYRLESEADIDEVIRSHFVEGKVVERLRSPEEPLSRRFFDLYGDISFFNRQSRVALRNSGIIDPKRIEEYIHYRGFEALALTLDRGDPEWIIGEISAAKLRGRGGGGYPTGLKWTLMRQNTETVRYNICNADEGDPGAFMDRSMLESDPFSIMEGMIIGAFAVGAQQGFVYVRAEYPMAIKRIEHALGECRAHGLLGKNILGSGWDYDIEVRLGAGAFVCGEETALIQSIEGTRGQPRVRPPYPTERGLWGMPTVINNVETFANVPAVLLYGGEWFASIGTEKSGGTKVFALSGKIRHTGLVEVPMGTTLREVVFDIGGGVQKGKRLKAVQTGGPAGGCIPEQWMDTVIDFETLAKAGSIMGSGGMIVLDEDDCMVDMAKFFMTFSQDESCGKCTPCREGTTRMLEILTRITEGKGEAADLVKLERLGDLLKRTSLCGLGRAAPNPVLSTLRQFRDEYEAHAIEKRCPAMKCKALIHYEIDPEKCAGCAQCARLCPVQCIEGSRRAPHVIDQSTCTRCGNCFEVCRFDAVNRK